MGWIERIPATFWGVLAGSCFTLLGVWLSNRAQAQRLERQLEHERTLKTQERTLTLKRDVFLPAAEAISAGVAAISRLPDLSIAHDRVLDDWKARSPSLARVSLVASDQTLEALTRFNSRFTTVLFGLFAVRTRLAVKSIERQSTMDEVTRLSSENSSRVALLEQLKLDGTADTSRRAAVVRDFEAAQERVRELLTRHEKLNRELFEEQLRFSQGCNRSAADLGDLTIPLTAAARAELGLPFDAEAYAAIVGEARRAAASDLESFIEDLRAVIAIA